MSASTAVEAHVLLLLLLLLHGGGRCGGGGSAGEESGGGGGAELWAACAAISFWVEASARVSAVEAAPSPAPSTRASSSASLSLSMLVSVDGELSEEDMILAVAAATAPELSILLGAVALTNQVGFDESG